MRRAIALLQRGEARVALEAASDACDRANIFGRGKVRKLGEIREPNEFTFTYRCYDGYRALAYRMIAAFASGPGRQGQMPKDVGFDVENAPAQGKRKASKAGLRPMAGIINAGLVSLAVWGCLALLIFKIWF